MLTPWAFLPLGLAVLATAVAAAEPGPLATWQRWMAALVILVMMPLTGEVLEDMADWQERRRRDGGP